MELGANSFTLTTSLGECNNNYLPAPYRTYLDSLLREANFIITQDVIRNFFAIESLTGEPFKRLFKAITGLHFNYSSRAYNEKIYCKYTDYNGLSWETKNIFFFKDNYNFSRRSRDNFSIVGSDIVSLYALLNRRNLVDSINHIYCHLHENEYKNSFEASDHKSHWTFEKKPLRNIELPLSICNILDYYRAREIKDFEQSTLAFPNTLIFTLNVDNSVMEVTFTLWKSKNGDLRWFAKDQPIAPLIQSSQKAIISSSEQFVVKAGEKIPGADIERKMLLSPLIESGYEVWIFGPAKSHKSRLARVLAHCFSHGGNFLGKYQAIQGTRLLYVDCELLPDKFDKQCTQECNGLGYPNERKFSLLLAKHPENSTGKIDLLDEFWKTIMNKEIEDNDVIILDCFAKLFSDKISTAGLNDIITPWKNKGKTFIIIDHTNRESELQGSINKLRSADLCLEITKEDMHHITLSFPVCRYLEPKNAEPLKLRVNFEDDKFYFSSCELKNDDKQSLENAIQRKIIAYILYKIHGLDPSQHIAPLFGYSTSSIYEWNKKFKESLKNNTLSQHEKELFQTYKKMSFDELKNKIPPK